MQDRMTDIAKQVEAYMEEHRQQLIALTQELVRVPSVAVTVEQEQCQEIMAQALEAAGAQVDRWIPDWEQVKRFCYPNTGETIYQSVELRSPEYLQVRDKVSVVAGTFQGKTPGKTLLFNGHIDAAGLGNLEEWTKDPWGAEIVDGKLYGRASADQKGGVAASLFGVMAARAVMPDLPGTIHFVVTPEEETGGNGTAASIARGYQADAAIFTDISNNEIVISNSGMQNFEITIQGGANGMWDADYDVSAAELMAYVIQRIHAFAKERDQHAREIYGFAAHETAACINPGLIECGEWLATIPRKARIKGLMAVLPDDDLIQLREDFTKRISDPNGVPFFAENPPQIFFGSGKEGCATSAEADIVLAAKQGMQLVSQKQVRPKYGCVCSDMTFYPSMFQTPSILFGPGSVLHCPDEYLEIDQLVEIAKAYAMTTILFLQNNGC